jgi:hypothetical protein
MPTRSNSKTGKIRKNLRKNQQNNKIINLSSQPHSRAQQDTKVKPEVDILIFIVIFQQDSKQSTQQGNFLNLHIKYSMHQG